MQNLEKIAKKADEFNPFESNGKPKNYSGMKESVKSFFSKPANYISEKIGNIISSVFFPYMK